MSEIITKKPKYQYHLPDIDGNKTEYTTATNSVIIIGANGSGKSKLGAWIEQNNSENVHRIGAQRNLNFNQNIQLKSYTEAENLVFYGSSKQRDKGHRWEWGKYTTKLLNDFEDVLAALIAQHNNQANEFLKISKLNNTNGSPLPNPPNTVIDLLNSVWESVFPQRKLIFEDSHFYASLGGDQYPANEMSDGERAVLYLASQVLCVPQNKTLIIDEPEVHLHRSIMNCLWEKLEVIRPDCLFIYITHDTQFASMHNKCDKIWVKSFNGSTWELAKIEDSALPEDLLLNILGSRKRIIFVEGESSSWDSKLYSAYYSDYLVIPCGSCSQVISRTKSFRACSDIHQYEVYGIIDRDYRSEYEINKYKTDGIYTLNVAEVENLFIVEELVRFIAERVGKNPDVLFSNVKKFVIETKFANLINRQVCESVVSEIKYKLSVANISDKQENEIKESLEKTYTSIDFEAIKKEKEQIFQRALESKDYAKVIKIFNHKGLSKGIEQFIGLDNYCECVVKLFQGKCKTEIAEILAKYLPKEIPAES